MCIFVIPKGYHMCLHFRSRKEMLQWMYLEWKKLTSLLPFIRLLNSQYKLLCELSSVCVCGGAYTKWHLIIKRHFKNHLVPKPSFQINFTVLIELRHYNSYSVPDYSLSHDQVLYYSFIYLTLSELICTLHTNVCMYVFSGSSY